VYLHSINGSPSSINERDNTVALQELELLETILQKTLCVKVPSGTLFKVKCAVHNQILVLVQHPQDITGDPSKILTLLEQTLHSLPTQKERQIELFLRIEGRKLPYARLSVRLEAQEKSYFEQEIQFDSSLSLFQPREEPLDLRVDGCDVSLPTPIQKKPKKPVLLGVLFLVVATGVGYLLTRPCVIFECRELQIAQQLQQSFDRLLSHLKSEEELIKLKQKFQLNSTALKSIPPWSLHHSQAIKLSGNLSTQLEKINRVIKALALGSQGLEKMQTQTNKPEELQARQQLFRSAIAPLEIISRDGESGLVKQKLLLYQGNLQAVNQQLVAQDKWLKKLTAAQAVARAAQERETIVQNLRDLQKVQSTWQVVVNALTVIPETSSAYQQARTLLGEYKPSFAAARDRATKEEMAINTYNQAVTKALQAKVYAQKNQWPAAVNSWEQSVNTAKQIPVDSLYYNQAQSLIEPYSVALQQAQEKLQIFGNLQKTRTDLERTCSGTVQVCDFMLTEQGITVQITTEYEQTLQSSLNDGNPSITTITSIQNHLQTLQQALDVISENASLPIIVYDAQGKEIHRVP
jgi:tetratricopeptide (TPR) repeat protein